jgi:hypothetical protein
VLFARELPKITYRYSKNTHRYDYNVVINNECILKLKYRDLCWTFQTDSPAFKLVSILQESFSLYTCTTVSVLKIFQGWSMLPLCCLKK